MFPTLSDRNYLNDLTLEQIVPQGSAALFTPNETRRPVPADHRSIARFARKEDPKYEIVGSGIVRLAKDIVDSLEPKFENSDGKQCKHPMLKKALETLKFEGKVFLSFTT